MIVQCVACSRKLKVPGKFAGRRFECPNCKFEQTALEFSVATYSEPLPAETVPKQTKEGFDTRLTKVSRKVSKNTSVVLFGGFWARFGSSFIDGFILFIIALVVNLIVLIPFRSSGSSVDGDLHLSLISLFLGFLTQLIYFATLESSASQATLGKSMVGLCVVSEDGNRISFLRAASRVLAKNISLPFFALAIFFAAINPDGIRMGDPLIAFICLLLYGAGILFFLVGYLMQPLTAKKQALHDIMAGTLVTKK